MSTLYFANCDFDLTLRGLSYSLSPRVYFYDFVFSFLVGGKGDALLSRITADEGYVHYVRGVLPEFTPLSGNKHQRRSFDTMVYWGVNDELNRVRNISGFSPYDNEYLERCRYINSRSYSFDLGSQLDGSFLRIKVNSLDGLEELFEKRQTVLVVKPGFGSAGTGFVFIEKREDLGLKKVKDLFRENSELWVEEWVDRVLDFSYALDIKSEGWSFLSSRLLINNKWGAFSSVESTKDEWSFLDDLESDFKSSLLAQVSDESRRIGEALIQEGYRGEANVDAFVYRKGGELFCNGLSEINCRRSMASLMMAYKEEFGMSYGAVLSLSPKEMTFISYSELEECRKNAEKEGAVVLLLTPLEGFYNSKSFKPVRLVFFVGAAKREVFEKYKKCIFK
jgi:hypothetical protein